MYNPMYDPIIELLVIWAWAMLVAHLPAPSRRRSSTEPGQQSGPPKQANVSGHNHQALGAPLPLFGRAVAEGGVTNGSRPANDGP